MSRWKAAAIHSSISAAIACAAAALMFIWFSPYFRAAGAPELILLLVGVDVCVGPLLTLIIFRSGKRGLLFDLACIGVLQTAALVYGLYVMSQSRPVFLVAAVDRFELIAANEISDSDLADGQEPQFRSRSWWGPRVVGVALPTDLEARNDLVFSGAGGRDIQNLPKYYCNYEKVRTSLSERAQKLEILRQKHPQDQQLIDDWLSRTDRTEASTVWIPLKGRKTDLVMLLDKTTAETLGTIAIDPW